MEWLNSRLPWNDPKVFSLGNLRPWMELCLPRGYGEYLPSAIELRVDRGVERPAVESLLAELPLALEREIAKRLARQERFVELGLFSEAELRKILTRSIRAQPWLLYYSLAGGVDAPRSQEPGRDPRGYKPCTSMVNHGVAWDESLDGSRRMWLVTARKRGQSWDWDSDIGHESAHAAFAPVPLFTQTAHASSDLACVRTGNKEVGGLGYPYSELAVVSVRGEPRPTPTGFPVVETADQLSDFLELSHRLAPGLGFDRALRAADRVAFEFDLTGGDEVLEVAAPIPRLMPALAALAGEFAPPTADWYGQFSALHQV